jgi:hypothetical protein
MRLFYLVSAIILTVLILIISFAQIGSACTWYLIGSTTNPVLVLLQMSGLGAITGGLLMLFWKAPTKDEYEEGIEQKNIDSGEK